jgi:mannan endo-1,6-alpha-mannosidase
MALCVQLAPWTAGYIIPKLRTSALAAANHCSYGIDNNTCALRWWTPDYDGWYGVGEQMSALETIQSNLINRVAPPATNTDRGNSMGTPYTNRTELARGLAAPTRGERNGAAALTTFSVLGSLMFFWWLVV